MKVLCITSDGYRHLVAGFAEAFNLHWPGMQRVDVLCYAPPEEELPENFHVHSLGQQELFAGSWTDGLRPYVERMTDERFVLFLEDYWLDSTVDLARVRMMDNTMRSLPEVAKCDLTDDRSKFPNTKAGAYIISSQAARYRTSLQAAIWRREYFLRFLKPHWTAWDFEIQGEKLAMNDKATICGTSDGIVHYRNVMLKGVVR